MTEVFPKPHQLTQQNMQPGALRYEHILFQMLQAGAPLPSVPSAEMGDLMIRRKGAGEEGMGVHSWGGKLALKELGGSQLDGKHPEGGASLPWS